MLIILAGLLVGLAIFGILAGVVIILTSPQGRVNARVRQYVAGEGPVVVAPSTVARTTRRRNDLISQLDARWEQRRTGQALVTELERGGLNLTVSEFLLLRISAAVGLGLFLALLAGPIWWLVLLPAAAVGWQLPRSYLRWSGRRRLNKLDNQLPDILNILAGSIRTGSSLLQALERIAREAEEPSRSEYLRVVRAISLGSPLETALLGLSERMPTEDVDMLVTAIGIQQQTGGNLGQILDLIATTVRERHRILREIEVLSATQRASALLLALLPLGIIGILFLISPSYIGRLFQPGLILVLPITGLILLAIGFFIMNRIASIDV
jgi:tight adherence protein B